MSEDTTKEIRNGRPFVDSDLYRDVIGHFASGVTILTTNNDATNFGLTCSAVASLSMDPPMLIACVNKQTGTCNAISESKTFGVNILHENQGDLAMKFARPNTDKFQGTAITYGEFEEPLLDGVLANLECRVAEEVTGGTHSIFLGEVQNAWVEEGMPLAYFRGKFGRFQKSNDENTYREIRRMILEREFKANQELELAELAYQLDVPQQSIYYTMTRLEAESVVQREEGNKYTVKPLDTKTLYEALDTRCALELAAARQAVGTLSEKEMTELQNRMKKTLPQKDGQFASADVYTEANTDFHDMTVAVAKNATLLNSYRRISAEAVMSTSIRSALIANDEDAHNELTNLADDHIQLVEAYKTGDVEKAEQMILQHNKGAKRLGSYLIDSSGGFI